MFTIKSLQMLDLLLNYQDSSLSLLPKYRYVALLMRLYWKLFTNKTKLPNQKCGNF